MSEPMTTLKASVNVMCPTCGQDINFDVGTTEGADITTSLLCLQCQTVLKVAFSVEVESYTYEINDTGYAFCDTEVVRCH